MEFVQKKEQQNKARLGAIGEYNVVSLLMQHGWDAFNANCSIKNYKSIDIVCLKNDNEDSLLKPEFALVQVKTCTQNNIPVGFNIEQCLDKVYLRKMVKGPYVFVYVNKTDGKYSFRYFILSRTQFVELVYAAHNYYVNGYKREKELKLKSLGGLYVRWLEGKSDEATDKHVAFENPLKGVTCEDCWNNIWEE